MVDRIQKIVLILFLLAPALVGAQASDTTVSVKRSPEAEAEARAKLARRGAGLIVGTWDLRGIEAPSGVEVSTLPLFGGWLRKGLDQRLAL